MNAPVEGGAHGEPAGIEYVGIGGVSKECLDAVLRFIQYGDRITHVRILSSSRDHCLLLTTNFGDLVAVKSGFASGYGGEGPRTFSYVLQVLETHAAEIEEYNVAPDLLDRLDKSALTSTDLEALDKSRPLRPSRWHDYVSEDDWEKNKKGTIWHEFPVVVPLAIIDSRIMDLAIAFWDGPDDKLLLGYRRLEDIIRERTGTDQHGTKLFSQVFNPKDGQLTWNDGDEGERAGKMNLFTGRYGAHRNRRAHRELREDREDLLAEFLLLNHLYRLERDSVRRETGEPHASGK
jgi:hypothetical protein